MNFFKKFLLIFLSAIFRGLGDRGCILMYHSIGDNSVFFTTHPKEFERQMKYLHERNYNIVPLAEICEKVKAGKPLSGEISITFDDGYEDVYKHAYPILVKYDFPATIFLPTAFIGKEVDFKNKESLRVVDESQIKEMLSSGLVTFMPHTQTHANLDGLPIEMAIKEIEDSRLEIERLSGQQGNILAYPRGRFNEKVVDYLRTSGKWLGALTSATGLVHSFDGPYKIRRIPVDSATSFTLFKARISRGIDMYQAIKKS